MPTSDDSTRSWAASPWVAFLGLGLAALGLARLLWTDGPDLGLVLLGLFLTTLSAHARTRETEGRQRRLFEVAMVVLLVAYLVEAFV